MLVPLSLGALYVVWGSTYLGMHVALGSFPPFLMNAIRFLLVGAGLYAALRARGVPNPTRAQAWNAARVGVILITGGNVLVTLAQAAGVATYDGATVVASMRI